MLPGVVYACYCSVSHAGISYTLKSPTDRDYEKILSTPTALIILICALLENLSATLLISCPLSCYYLNHLVARGEKQCSSLDLLCKQKSFILQVFSECIYAIAATVKR